MRTGVTASVTAHIAVILIAIIGLNHAQQLTPDAEQSIAVDLVPVTDTTSTRMGSEQSKVIDTKTPAMIETNQPADPAKPTGNTQQDFASLIVSWAKHSGMTLESENVPFDDGLEPEE